MPETDFYAKKGALSIRGDGESITVVRRGSKTGYSHTAIALIPLALVSVFMAVVLLFPESAKREDYLYGGAAFLGVFVLTALVVTAIWSVRETVTLDAEGLHVHYNWFRRSLCRFVPLREVGDFVRWTIVHKHYYNGIRIQKYKRYEIHGRTLGNRVCFAYGMNEEFCEAAANRLQTRLAILQKQAETQPAEHCLLRTGKTPSRDAQGDIPPLGIAKHGRPQNLVPISESRWHSEIDEYGDLILANSKTFNFAKLSGVGLGTLVTVLGAIAFVMVFPPSGWGRLVAERGVGFVIFFAFLALCGLAVSLSFLWMIVDRFHSSRWCFSKNGDVDRTWRLFGVPRHRDYEDGMQFVMMVIADDYGSLEADQYQFSDERWELIFYDADKDPMFRIDSLYRGEAHWLADQILKFCNDS